MNFTRAYTKKKSVIRDGRKKLMEGCQKLNVDTGRQTPLSSSPKKALLPVHFRTGTDAGQRSRFVCTGATVPVQVEQRSRLLPQTGTNALATNTWGTARHWSRLLAKM